MAFTSSLICVINFLFHTWKKELDTKSNEYSWIQFEILLKTILSIKLIVELGRSCRQRFLVTPFSSLERNKNYSLSSFSFYVQTSCLMLGLFVLRLWIGGPHCRVQNMKVEEVDTRRNSRAENNRRHRYHVD